MNFIKNSKDILDIKINSIQDTYPIYHKEYKVAFNTVLKGVKSFSKNIHLLGRSGAYWYNNSDHSIRMAIELAKKLLKNNHDLEFDYRKYF
jgi:protoporphyrinogen oxidase